MWSVNRGKAFLTVPDTTVSLKVEVLTLSGLQQIEINRFDAATRGVAWEEHPPSRDQKKVVNQYLKYLSKMWENDKAEGPNVNPPPSVYSRDPRRQTGQHHQNLVQIKSMNTQPIPAHLPSNISYRPGPPIASAPIPIPTAVPIAVLTPVEQTIGPQPPPSYQMATRGSALEAALLGATQKIQDLAPKTEKCLKPVEIPKTKGMEALKKTLKRRYLNEGKTSEEWEVCDNNKCPKVAEASPRTPCNSPENLIIDTSVSDPEENTEKPMEM